MVQETVRKKNRWLYLFAVLVLVPLCAYLALFQINQFNLVVHLKGPEEMTVSMGEEFVDPGIETKIVGSLFFRDGIPVDAGNAVFGDVDTAVVGEYKMTYRSRFREMEGRAERIIHVVDTTPPSITLVSEPGSYTIIGEEYVEEGYSAWDDCDGDLTQRVIREVKDGMVTYTVEDEAGNRTAIARKIHYIDITPPNLTLSGGDTVFVNSGQGYTEPGWTAQDDVDGDVSGWVKVSGYLDKYLAGSYQLTYTVKDHSGNCAEVYRTIMVQGKKLPETVRPKGKVIYLTFDDGPGPYTQRLLEILDQYDAKATFFVVDTKNIDIICDIVEQGHAIGIHSLSHDYGEIYASADAYFADILGMQQIIYDKTGVMTYLMRFPGGSSNTVSRFNPGIMTYLTQAVEDMGFCYFDWNVDSNDAGGARDAETVFENVIAGVKNRRISIVLQHDIKDFSVEAVEKILQWGEKNGYQFLPLDMTSPTSHHGVNN